jgi:hypothetical protein
LLCSTKQLISTCAIRGLATLRSASQTFGGTFMPCSQVGPGSLIPLQLGGLPVMSSQPLGAGSSSTSPPAGSDTSTTGGWPLAPPVASSGAGGLPPEAMPGERAHAAASADVNTRKCARSTCMASARRPKRYHAPLSETLILTADNFRFAWTITSQIAQSVRALVAVAQ